MNRRGFFGWLASLLCIGTKVQEVEQGYLFDWSMTGPDDITDDPHYKGKLHPGFHNHVTVNDEPELDLAPDFGLRPFRFFTGPDGWVEYYVYKERGLPVLEIWDRWKLQPATEPLKYQIRHPQGCPCGLCPGDGTERYEERIKVHKVYGHVRFWTDEDIG